jgi:electron transfer flavoprotein alpha/beta subunit
VLDAAALGLDPSTVGVSGSMVKESGWSAPPSRPAGRILEGESAEVVSQLITLLRDEAKVL